MTKLDNDRKLKKEVGRDEEIIEAIGKEGKEGIKNAKEYFKEEEKKALDVANAEKNFLAEKKRKADYLQELVRMLTNRLAWIDLPKDWKYKVGASDVGIVMEIGKGGRMFRSAFKATFSVEIDTNACDVFALRAAETVVNVDSRTSSGIYLEGGIKV